MFSRMPSIGSPISAAREAGAKYFFQFSLRGLDALIIFLVAPP